MASHAILHAVLATISTLAWSAYVADIGPNETQVILAGIGAVTSLVNMIYLGRARRERRRHQAAVRQAIGDQHLVAMVPEDVVKDVVSGQSAQTEPHDQAP